jgi:hypothetical protein
MGFFKKLFKGVKKVFKKVGKGIKKVVGKVGKFMNKTGIVGQIAMSFLLPGIGGMLGKAAGAMMGSASAIVRGAGTFLNTAVNIATKAGSLVKSVGDGVMKVVGQTVGTAINQIPGAGEFIKGFTKGGIDITKMENFSDIMDTASKAITDVAAKGGDLFSMDTLTGTNKYAKAAQAAKAKKIFEEQIEPFDTGYTPEDMVVDYQDGVKSSFDVKPLDISDPDKFFKISTETGKLYSAADPGMGYTPSFDSEGFNTSVQSSLLSAPVKTLTAEEIAQGQMYDVGSPTGVSQATTKSGVFSAANVGSAVRKTFGSDFAQDTQAYGSQYAVDIPEQEEYQLYAFGASPLQRSQNQLTTVQYFTGVTAVYVSA